MPPHQPKLAGSRINRQSVAYLVSETSKNIQETPQLDPNATPELIAALDFAYGLAPTAGSSRFRFGQDARSRTGSG